MEGATEMESYFIDKKHEDRLLSLMVADNTHVGDAERISLFYIISGNEDLYAKRRAIYDFKDHCIKHCTQDREVDFSSGMYALIRLGYNLYNGYQDHHTSPFSLFYCLDEQNRKVAVNAIRLRFDGGLNFS